MKSEDMAFEITVIPCGLDCGTTYVIPGLVERVEAQQIALSDGWHAVEDDDGNLVMACGSCSQAKRTRMNEGV